MLFNKSVIWIYSLPGDFTFSDVPSGWDNQMHTEGLPAKREDLAGLFILKLLS